VTVTRTLGRTYVISPPPSLVASGPEFGCHARIAGESYEFTFSWNRSYFFYAINIMGQSAGRIRKLYPTTSDPIDVRNFNPNDRNFPHATILMQDVSGQEGPAMPFNLGVTHSLVVMTWGEVET